MIDIETIRANHTAVRQAAGVTREHRSWDEATEREAALAVAGKLLHHGEPVAIGRADIDWSAAHVDHHTWRSKPNRFIYLGPLLAGYAHTAEARYAEAARDYIADWIRAHPGDPATWRLTQPDNGLNVPIRVGLWLDTVAACAPEHGFDEPFVGKVVESIRAQLNWVTRNLSAGGNFRMMQAMALVKAGLILPFVEEADRWKSLGVAVLNDAARRQILPDGAHIECTGGYHTWMTQLFGQCIDLQHAFPDLGLAVRVEEVAKMHDYGLASTRPNGTFIGINDIEGRDTGAHENRPAEARRAFRAKHNLPDLLPDPRQIFPHARQAMLRDRWDQDAMLATVDGSRRGSAHVHLARNSVTLHALGRSMVIDPGRLDYEMSNPAGPYCKSTPAHATVNLNGWNQFTGEADRFEAHAHEEFACVIGRYTGGYWPGRYGWWYDQGIGPGIAAFHDRAVFVRAGKWMAVVDHLTRWPAPEGSGPAYQRPTLEVNWPLAHDGSVHIDADGRAATVDFPDRTALRIVTPLAPEETRFVTHRGSTQPYRGWARGDLNHHGAVPAPLLSLAAQPWRGYVQTIVTVLIPHRADGPPALRATAHHDIPGKPNAGELGHLRLAWDDGTIERVWWTVGLTTMIGHAPAGPDAAPEEAAFDTDGFALYARQSNGDPPSTQAVDATYCRPASSG